MFKKPKMVNYSIKIPPEMIPEIEAAARTVKTRFNKPGVTLGAFIRRAIRRDLDHRKRSQRKE